MSTLAKLNPFRKSDELDLLRPSLRWDPFREMEDLMRGLQRTLSLGPTSSGESLTNAEWTPCVDITEDDKEFLVKAELPDVKKEDIKVNVENGTLCIRGERKTEKEENVTKFHRIERSYGRFERYFTVPGETNEAKITSEYKDGILMVHLPKDPKAKPATHEIAVK